MRSYCSYTLLVVLLSGLISCYSDRSDPLLQSTVSTDHGHSHLPDASYLLLERGITRFVLSENQGHSHGYQVDAANFLMLKQGYPLEIISQENQFHTHRVYIIKFDN